MERVESREDGEGFERVEVLGSVRGSGNVYIEKNIAKVLNKNLVRTQLRFARKKHGQGETFLSGSKEYVHACFITVRLADG